ncbi:hypothetical protein Tco_1461994, partial [Tanacetum coccineum]
MMRQLPPEPSRQEAFEDLAMNYILDQEEKVMPLKEYMGVIRSDSMQLSLEVKMTKHARSGKSTRGQSSNSRERMMKEKVSFLATHGLARNLFDNINTDAFTGPQWANLFQMDEPVFRKLMWKFFASFEFDSVACRVGLYSEEQSRLASTRSGLRRGEAIKVEHVLMGFWPTIGDGEFVVGGMAVKKVRDLRI